MFSFIFFYNSKNGMVTLRFVSFIENVRTIQFLL